MEYWKIDMRTIHLEQRQLTSGEDVLFQNRSRVSYPDGSTEGFSDWETTSRLIKTNKDN